MLGHRIALLRKNAGLSQSDLAKILGVTASAVGMYEQGRREPPCDILIAIARQFGVSLDFLLTGCEPESLTAHKLSTLFPGIEDLTIEELVVLLAAHIIGEL